MAHVLSQRCQIEIFTVPFWFSDGVLCVIYAAFRGGNGDYIFAIE